MRWVLALLVCLALGTGALAEDISYDVVYTDGVALVGVVGFDAGEACRVLDAVMLGDEGVVICGGVSPGVDGGSDAWAALVDTGTGVVRWLLRGGVDDVEMAQGSYHAAAAWEDGFVLCRTDGVESLLEYRGTDGALQRAVMVDGRVFAMRDGGTRGGTVVAGERDGLPWAAWLDTQGEVVWDYAYETDAQEAYYSCLDVTKYGVLLGGEEPRHIDRIDFVDWAGNLRYTAREGNAGRNEDVKGIWLQGNSLVYVCGTNEDAQGMRYATSGALDATLGILCGPQERPAESGYHGIAGVWTPGMPEDTVAMTAGYTTWNALPEDASQADAVTQWTAGGTDVRFSWVTRMGHDAYPYQNWIFPFGDDSEAVRIVQDDAGTVFIIGHGNGTGLDAEASEGTQAYVVRMALPAVEGVPGNG